MHREIEIVNVPDSVWYWHSQRESLHVLACALREAVELETDEASGWRKLAHIRFVASMLQSHVEWLFALEKHGHLTELRKTHPELAHRIDHLREEHLALSAELADVVRRLHDTRAADTVERDLSYDDLQSLIHRIEAHVHEDNRLLQDAYDQDLGGEAGA